MIRFKRLHTAHRFYHNFGIYDVISVKDITTLLATDRYGYLFVYADLRQILDRRPAQILNDGSSITWVMLAINLSQGPELG